MQHLEAFTMQEIILRLEAKYPFFKKMDIYSTVTHAYRKVHGMFREMSDDDFDEIEKKADQDLRLSVIGKPVCLN
jgi:hypothetical protein